MDKKNSLRKKMAVLKEELETSLRDYLSKVDDRDITSKKIIRDSWQETGKLLKNGGKRLRPILLFLIYDISGKKNLKKIMPVALAIELLHAFFLVHDDIIDKGRLRHGTPTLNEVYRKKSKIFAKAKEDSVHFGNSIALLLGDRLVVEAFKLVLESKLSDIQKSEIMRELVEMIRTTICGETLDVMASFPKNSDFTEIKKITAQIIKNKTAYYTFVVPMKLGGVLRGLFKNQIDFISEIGFRLGEIFQWQDDLMDIFSDEKNLGKPAGADLQEKKPTLLLIYTLEKLSIGDGNKLKKLMGKKLSIHELNEARQLIKKSGADEQMRKKINQSVKKVNEKIQYSSSLTKELKDTLSQITESVYSRSL